MPVQAGIQELQVEVVGLTRLDSRIRGNDEVAGIWQLLGNVMLA